MSDEKQQHENRSHGHGKGHGGGHGGGEHEESGAPEWLISFADNTALIMGFFVILLAMNMGKPPPTGGGESEAAAEAGQTAAALDWAISVREAFHNPVDLDSTDPRDALLVARLRERLAGDGGRPTSSTIGPELTHETVKEGTQFTVDAAVVFDVGSIAIKPEEHDKLARIAELAAGRRTRVIVRGHSYGLDVPNAAGLDHRDLSYRRAKAVAAYLEGVCGLRSDAIMLQAMGNIDPVEVRHYTAADQRANRRVEVILTEIPIDNADPELNFTEAPLPATP